MSYDTSNDIKRILITGAGGFLGSYVVKSLILEGYEVVALKRKGSNLARLSQEFNQVEFIESCDLEVTFTKRRIDAVIHLATSYGRGPLEIANVIDSNLFLPSKLLELSSKYGTQLFVNTSTFSAKEKFSKYLPSYHLSKRQLIEWFDLYDWPFKLVTLNLHHVYGPQDNDDKFVPSIINQIIGGVPILETTPGEQRRDFIYVEDVATSYVSVIKNWNQFNKRESFDVGTGRSTSILELINAIIDICIEFGLNRPQLKIGALDYRPNEIMNAIADPQQLCALGWLTKTDLQIGLKNTIKYYIERRRSQLAFGSGS